MRSYDAATIAALTATEGRVARILIWVTAKDRTTGAPQSLGFWSGAEAATFVIGGASRVYVGGGALMNLAPLVYRTGLAVQTQELVVSPLAPVIVAAVRTYDLRFAPIEIHRALFSPTTRALVSDPHAIYKGTVNADPITTPQIGDDFTCTFELVSSARDLTRSLPMYKSDATQQRRGGDRFRRYIDISGAVETVWGEKRSE